MAHQLQEIFTENEYPVTSKEHLIDHTQQLIRFCKLPKDYVFFDVGTNVSVVTDEVLRYSDKGMVHCFEPHPVLFDNLALKHKDHQNVILNEVAVSNQNGKDRFFFNEEPDSETDQGSTLKHEKFLDKYDQRANQINISDKLSYVIIKSLYVKTIKLSDYILNNDIATIDVLKMDAEGSEYDILEDLIESNVINRIKYIFFECHIRKIPKEAEKREKILTQLENLGIETYYW